MFTCVEGHLRSRHRLGALRAGANHVGLEHGALEQDVVIGERLVDIGENLLRNLKTRASIQ